MSQIILEAGKLLHKTQLEVYNNRTRFTVIVAGRRWGKSKLCTFIIFTEALSKRGVYWWVSPTRDVGTPAWRHTRYFIKKVCGANVKINETTRTIELPNGSIIEFKSADNPDSLRGEGLSGLVMDEVAQVKEEAWNLSLRPALSDKLGWAIFIGTPNGRGTKTNSSLFFHLFKMAEKEKNWSRFIFTSYDNPYMLIEEIEEYKRTHSEREFRQEYLAEFVSEEGFIFRKEWFKDRYINSDVFETYISWDTAASVSNSAAYSCGIVGHITKDYKLHIAEVYREKLEFPQLQYRIETLARKYLKTLRMIVIEQKSSGIGVIQSLVQTSDRDIAERIYPYNPKGSKEFRGYAASNWCEKGMVQLPNYENNIWLVPFEDELFNFSHSSNDYKDQVDAFSQLVDITSNYLERGLHREN